MTTLNEGRETRKLLLVEFIDERISGLVPWLIFMYENLQKVMSVSLLLIISFE